MTISTLHWPEKLVATVGLRNLLIHEYVAIDLAQLYGFLDHLKDFEQFVAKTAKIL
jgi:uncharacterized protein YutE (UPF0331/DUF86 family)